MDAIAWKESRIRDLRLTIKYGPRPTDREGWEAKQEKLQAELADAERELETMRSQMARDTAAFMSLFQRYGIPVKSPSVGIADLTDLIAAMAVERGEPGFKFVAPRRLAASRDAVRIGEVHRRVEQTAVPRRRLECIMRAAEAARQRAAKYRRRANGGPGLSPADHLWPVTNAQAEQAEHEAADLRAQAENAGKQLANLPPMKTAAEAAKETRDLIESIGLAAAAAATNAFDSHFRPPSLGQSRNKKASHQHAAEAAAVIFLFDPQVHGDDEAAAFRQSFGRDARNLVFDAIIGAKAETEQLFGKVLETVFDDEQRREILGQHVTPHFAQVIANAFRTNDLEGHYSRWVAKLDRGDVEGLPTAKDISDFFAFREHCESLSRALLRRVDPARERPKPIAKMG